MRDDLVRDRDAAGRMTFAVPRLVLDVKRIPQPTTVTSIPDQGTPMSKISISAFAAALLASGAAFAHPEFQSAEPPAGKASAAPKQIRILFNESVIPQFSGIALKDQSSKTIPTGKATVDPSNKKMMIVPLKDQLAPGDYRVEWHAVSDDTHKVKGSYSFSVAP